MTKSTQPIVLLALLCTVLTSTLHAQDPRFSQYYASPYTLNPAMSAIFNGQWRVTANYRDQWSSILSPNPFRTYAVAADYRKNVGRYDYWAAGVGAVHDEAGVARFQQNKIHFSGAYLKQLAGGRNRTEHYLAAGAQVGFGQHSVDWGRLWFSRQFDPNTETPDLSASNGENGLSNNTPLYLDFNAGLLWYAVFENGGFMYAGGAAHHLNRPNVALLDNASTPLYTRWAGHVGGQLPLSETFSVLPGVQVMSQGPAFETDLGVNFRYSNNDLNELALRAGAWARVGNKLDKGLQADAVTVVAMVELNRWMLGLSYDFTVSKLALANNSRGAFEVSLTYFHPESRRSRVTCPRF